MTTTYPLTLLTAEETAPPAAAPAGAEGSTAAAGLPLVWRLPLPCPELSAPPAQPQHSRLLADLLSARKAEAAAQLGLDPERVGTVTLDLETLKRLGVLVDVSVHGISALTTRASWAELGIPEGDVRRRRLRRGTKELFPAEVEREFCSIESGVRHALSELSWDVQGFRPFRWVPLGAYDRWQARWHDFGCRWAAAKGRLLDRYDEHRAAYLAALAGMAREAWDALTARAAAGGPGAGMACDGQTFRTAAEFVDRVVEMGDRFPSREALDAGLALEYHTALVITGMDVEGELAQEAGLRAARFEAHAREQAAVAQAQQAEAGARRTSRLADLAVEEERRALEDRLEAMHRANLAHAREQLAEVVSPLKDLFERMRARIYADAARLADGIRRNGCLRGQSAQAARSLHETFRLLAVSGDEELERRLLELQQLLVPGPADDGPRYATAAVLGELEDIADLTHQAALDVERRALAQTRAGALEL